jgi:hypothetical protein
VAESVSNFSRKKRRRIAAFYPAGAALRQWRANGGM